MSSRKKPQQQLACYFDELLTELDDPSATAVGKLSVSDECIDENLIKEDSSKQAIFNESVVKETPEVTASEVPAHKIADPEVKDTFERDGTTVNAISTAATMPSSSSYRAQNSASLSLEPIAKTTTTISESLPAVDLRQREKDKLERLLKTLTPAPQPVIDIPVDGAEKTAKVVTEASPVIATSEVDKVVETITLPNDTIEALSDIAEDAVAPLDMISTSPHRWEPLAHDWQDNGRPIWAENAFDVLLVDVNGVKLAMPLQALDAIYPLEKELTPLFGQAKWFMGLQKTIAGNVNIINTAQFVMPERYDEDKPSHSVPASQIGLY